VKRAGVITIKDTVIKPNIARNIWQLTDFQKFIDSVERSDYHLIYSLLFYCGIRRGEALGLRVKDVDLESGIIHIEQNKTIQGMDSPKTKSSRRTVALPSNVIAEMEKFIKRKYKPAPSELVFSLSPDRITKFFAEKQEEIGMTPRIRLHDLRHSHASMLINLGFSPDVIADRLGHKDASMVMMVYGHMYPQKRIEVIDALEKAIDGK
jgi:integrase